MLFSFTHSSVNGKIRFWSSCFVVGLLPTFILGAFWTRRSSLFSGDGLHFTSQNLRSSCLWMNLELRFAQKLIWLWNGLPGKNGLCHGWHGVLDGWTIGIIIFWATRMKECWSIDCPVYQCIMYLSVRLCFTSLRFIVDLSGWIFLEFEACGWPWIGFICRRLEGSSVSCYSLRRTNGDLGLSEGH